MVIAGACGAFGGEAVRPTGKAWLITHGQHKQQDQTLLDVSFVHLFSPFFGCIVPKNL